MCSNRVFSIHLVRGFKECILNAQPNLDDLSLPLSFGCTKPPASHCGSIFDSARPSSQDKKPAPATVSLEMDGEASRIHALMLRNMFHPNGSDHGCLMSIILGRKGVGGALGIQNSCRISCLLQGLGVLDRSELQKLQSGSPRSQI